MFNYQHCPLFQSKLSVAMRVLYSSGVWSYVVGAISTPTFIIIPAVTIWFGVFPIVVSQWTALGVTVYYFSTNLVRPSTLIGLNPKTQLDMSLTCCSPGGHPQRGPPQQWCSRKLQLLTLISPCKFTGLSESSRTPVLPCPSLKTGGAAQVLYYVRSFYHIEALWFANVANQLMWWAPPLPKTAMPVNIGNPRHPHMHSLSGSS